MATYTTNFNLAKPEQNEAVDIDVLNNNSDIIDDNLGQAKQLASNIGYGYNNNVSYSIDDYCVYDNKLYKCIQNIIIPEDFDLTKWQQCNISNELQNIKGNPNNNATEILTKLQIGNNTYQIEEGANDNIADAYDVTSTYAVGDYVIYHSVLYKCITAVSSAEPFDSTKWTSCLVTDEMGSGGGGGNADVVHLTQAEYDALPSSKLSDDKIYMIEDVTSKEVEGEHYSTNEQIVGEWIDGSPIYQITEVLNSVITINSSANASFQPSWFSSVDMFISCMLYRRDEDSQYGAACHPAFARKNTDTNKLNLYSAQEFRDCKIITFQYTKTSS